MYPFIPGFDSPLEYPEGRALGPCRPTGAAPGVSDVREKEQGAEPPPVLCSTGGSPLFLEHERLRQGG